ncbi:MFS transporter [Amycolatopsis sp. cmx-11-32]|uniref:MFS transporter n=1 Tax=Amycolatopsis sp. cmx-11-32 TaxID=2785796 RepID=UPI0039E242CF
MTATRPPKQHSGTVLGLGCLVLFVDGYDLFSLGTIAPSLLRDPAWGATPATLGLLGSLTALGMPFGSIIAGRAADRRGPRLPLLIAITGISVAMLGAGLAPGLAGLGIARFVTGMGVGALAPLVGTMVANAAPAHRRTLHLAAAMGSIGAGGTLSALLGRLLLPHAHFQVVFLLGALPILLLPLIRAWAPAHPPITSDTRRPLRRLFTPATRRSTILLWIAAFSSMTLVYSTTSWLPTVLMNNGYALTSSLEFSIAFTVGASIGGLAVSIYADRGHLRLVTTGTFLLAAAALFTLSTQQPRPLLLLVSALAGLGALGGQNMLIACLSALYPPALRGTSLGYGLGIGRLGAIAGPAYLALVTTLIASPRAGFYAFMVPALIGAAALYLVPKNFATTGEPTRDRLRNEPEPTTSDDSPISTQSRE